MIKSPRPGSLRPEIPAADEYQYGQLMSFITNRRAIWITSAAGDKILTHLGHALTEAINRIPGATALPTVSRNERTMVVHLSLKTP